MLLLVLCALCVLGCIGLSVHQEIVKARVRSFSSQRIVPERVERISVPHGEVDINREDTTLLMTLPQVGEKRAQAIIDEHQARGDFYYPEDLLAVKGIGAKRLEDMRDLLLFTEP